MINIFRFWLFSQLKKNKKSSNSKLVFIYIQKIVNGAGKREQRWLYFCLTNKLLQYGVANYFYCECYQT